MNDPKRLLLGEASERERALLQAGAAEEPPPDGAAKLAVALGLVGPSQPTTLPTPRAPHALSGKLATKWLALAGAGLAAVSGAWLLVPTQGSPPSARPALPEEHAATPSTTSVPSSANEAAPGVPTTVPATEAEARSPTEEAQASSISAEITQLERVRTLLRSGKSAAALAALAAYDAAYHHGALREEAEFMRIEALTGAERGREASEHARRFLRAHPDSVHGARVRELSESRDAR